MPLDDLNINRVRSLLWLEHLLPCCRLCVSWHHSIAASELFTATTCARGVGQPTSEVTRLDTARCQPGVCVLS